MGKSSISCCGCVNKVKDISCSMCTFVVGRNTGNPVFDVNPELNKKISLWQGDITTLEIDAIVNAGKFTFSNNAVKLNLINL